MKQLALMLLLTSQLFSQTAILLDSNSAPLGAQLTFQGPADIYGKVFQYKQDCSNVAWSSGNELATVRGNSFNHFPPADWTGWAGYWCYGVDAGSGPVSIKWPVAMGMKWYVDLFYFNPDCSPRQGPASWPGQFQVTVTRIQDGTAIMPQVEGVLPYRYAGFMRLKSYGKVNVHLVTPLGRAYDFTDVFRIGGVPAEDDTAPYLEVDLNSDGSESICSAYTRNYEQKGVNNH